MEPTKHQLVAVEWEDSSSWNGWQDSERIKGRYHALRCFSMGAIIENTPTHITLSGTWDEQDPFRVDNPTTIPKGCIRRVTEIKWPRKSMSRKKK